MKKESKTLLFIGGLITGVIVSKNRKSMLKFIKKKFHVISPNPVYIFNNPTVIKQQTVYEVYRTEEE